MITLNDAQKLVPHHCLIGNTRIAHGVHGPQDGEPVVLVHGTPSSSMIWRDVVTQLTAAGYRVHVFDLLGFGLSERPWNAETDTSVGGQVPILAGLFAEWGLKKAHVAAHDIGGSVGMKFTLHHPELVHSLTILDACSYDSWPSKRTHIQMQEGLEALITKPAEAHREHYREWLYTTVENEPKLADETMELYLDYISGPIGQASYYQHQMMHYDPKHTMDFADRMGELGASRPVQLIWGEEDAWQVKAWAQKIHEAIPGSELHLIPGAGHFVMEDAPEAVGEQVLAFIQANPLV